MEACTAAYEAAQAGPLLVLQTGNHGDPGAVERCATAQICYQSCNAPLGFAKWMTPSSFTRFTSSMPGMVLTPRRLSVLCSRLSSVVVVLCCAFFFLQSVQDAARGGHGGRASRPPRAG